MNSLIKSIVAGLGMGLLYLAAGLVLDYLITQALSQFVLADCSEDCYFRYFNGIFVVVALVSLAGGIRAGVRTYNKSKTS